MFSQYFTIRRARSGRRTGILAVALAVAITALFATSATAAPTGPAGDAFYNPPSPLSGSANGDLIWQRPSNAIIPTAAGFKAWKILYRSESALGEPVPVSGTLVVPTKAWSGAGKRPLVTFAPGTLGMGDQCAYSKQLEYGLDFLVLDVPRMLERGYAVVITDYEGLGTPGTHPYVVGRSLGKGVLDAVRAAWQLPEGGVDTTTPTAILGYSEGGAGALWAAQLHATYAPDIKLVGAAGGGSPSDLRATALNNDGNVGAGVLFYAAIGLTSVHPEIDLYDELTDEGKRVYDTAAKSCLPYLALHAFRKMSSFMADGETTFEDVLNRPEWRAALDAYQLGNIAIDAPTFLYHGLFDEINPVSASRATRRRWCARGVKVDYREYWGEHVTAYLFAETDALNWVAARFAGKRPRNNC
jgi:pimeloyl-ACP methyl ester carboxylesterase